MSSLGIRALKKEEEAIWLDFVSSVFEKTGRDYFERHINNDPDKEYFNHVFVCVAPQTDNITEISQIFGTLRVFQRAMYMGNKKIAVGGIGEVSVSKLHRRKGIATLLLQRAIEHMKQGNPECIGDNDSIYSTLHTGEAAPLYKSVGYSSVPLSYSIIEKFDKKICDEFIIEEASFSVDEISVINYRN